MSATGATGAAMGSAAVATRAGEGVETRPRLAYVDGVRALAALYVVVTHAFRMVWTEASGRGPAGVLGPLTWWLAYGHFAVSVFIVVSGFSLMLGVVRAQGRLKGGVRGFLWRRCRRILPPYYAALGLALILIATLIGTKTGTIWDVALPVNPVVAGIHVLMLHDLLVPYSVNYAFWSIAVEFHIYFLFPPLIWLWRRVGALPAVAGAVALSALLYLMLFNSALNSLNPQYIALFALGMLAAQVSFGREARWERLRAGVPWGLVALVALGVLAVICALAGQTPLPNLTALDGLAGVAAASVLLVAARPARLGARRVTAGGWLRGALEWRPLVAVGLFSYSLYLIHAPLLQVIWQYGLRPLGLGAVATWGLLEVVGVPLIVGAAYVFFLAFERPFLTSAGVGKRAVAAINGRRTVTEP